VKTIEELLESIARATSVPDPLRHVLLDLPWQAIEDAYRAMLAAGERPGKAADKIAKLLDQLVDFRELVPGAGGQALELADGPVIRLTVALVLRFGLKLGA
jgi:hypothetical protein